MLRSFSLTPTLISARRAAALRSLQPLWNRLYDGVARDVAFVTEALDYDARRCSWVSAELEAFKRLEPHTRTKPRLLLPNSVYLQPHDADADDVGWLTVPNVQAGEPYQNSLVNGLQNEEHACDDDMVLEPGPLRTVCGALADAARLVHPEQPVVAVLAKPLSSLALRTRVDVRGVGSRLRAAHGVRTLYVSADDLADATLEPKTNDLLLDGVRISVVYVRYDFSHPFGAHVPPESAGAVSEGQLARLGESGYSAEALRREAAAVDLMERSSAVVSSSLGARLAHRRRVQFALTKPGALERFLTRSEAAELRGVLPQQWALGPEAGFCADDALFAFESDPSGFVGKSSLRPRTGSGLTQGRHASSGGMILDSERLASLVRCTGDPVAAWTLLYPKVEPARHDATLVHAGVVHELRRAAVSEVASYGAFLATPAAGPCEEAGRVGVGDVLLNVNAGLGARTRPAETDHPLSAELGYGAISAVATCE